jgi:hypothetical protein
MKPPFHFDLDSTSFLFFPVPPEPSTRLYHVITQRPQRHQAKAMEKQIAASRSTTSIGRSSWSLPPAPQNAGRGLMSDCARRKDPVISGFWWRKTGVFSFQHVKSIQIPNPKSSKKAHSDFITPLQVSAVQLLIYLSSMALMTPSLASYGATSDDADWRGSSSLETMVSSLLSLIASVKFYSDSSLFSPSL